MKLSEQKRICEEATQGEWSAVYNEKVDRWEIHRKSKKWGDGCWIANMKMGEETKNVEATAKFMATFFPSRVKKMIELLELARDFIGTNSIDQMNGYHEVPEAKSWLKTYKSEFENES